MKSPAGYETEVLRLAGPTDDEAPRRHLLTKPMDGMLREGVVYRVEFSLQLEDGGRSEVMASCRLDAMTGETETRPQWGAWRVRADGDQKVSFTVRPKKPHSVLVLLVGPGGVVLVKDFTLRLEPFAFPLDP